MREQVKKLIREIEGRLNDFDSGISDKEETLESFTNLILDVSRNVAKGELNKVISQWADYLDSEAYIAINARITALTDAGVEEFK